MADRELWQAGWPGCPDDCEGCYCHVFPPCSHCTDHIPNGEDPVMSDPTIAPTADPTTDAEAEHLLVGGLLAALAEDPTEDDAAAPAAEWVATGQHLSPPLTLEADVRAEALRAPRDEDGLPTRLGAVVRATVEAADAVLALADDNEPKWLRMPTHGSSWFNSSDLSDVEVLYPGPQS